MDDLHVKSIPTRRDSVGIFTPRHSWPMMPETRLIIEMTFKERDMFSLLF